MTVSCVVKDTVTPANTLTVGSVTGTDNVTLTTNGTLIRNVESANVLLGIASAINVGITVSANYATQALVNEPGTPANTVTIKNHPTDRTLCIVTINAVDRTLLASEFSNAVQNCVRDS